MIRYLLLAAVAVATPVFAEGPITYNGTQPALISLPNPWQEVLASIGATHESFVQSVGVFPLSKLTFSVMEAIDSPTGAGGFRALLVDEIRYDFGPLAFDPEGMVLGSTAVEGDLAGRISAVALFGGEEVVLDSFFSLGSEFIYLRGEDADEWEGVEGEGVGEVSVFYIGREFEDARVLFRVSAEAAVIPEPAGWVMMIAGFGLVGFAARRRRARQLA